MSFSYGLNGNDIDWSFSEFADMSCVDCDRHLKELREVNPDHDVDTCEEEDCELCEWEDGNWICDGHTTLYTDNKTYALYHDTNDNFVTVVQLTDIPNLSMYNDEYLVDWYLSGSADEETDEAIRKELAERNVSIEIG